ncbi:hypothetical protein MTO96_042637 [Rhipicephalus appendiculatus]
MLGGQDLPRVTADNAERKVTVDCKLGYRGASCRDAPAHSRMSWGTANGDDWPRVSSFKVGRYGNHCVGTPPQRYRAPRLS